MKIFDYTIVGSSPLLMMIALKLSKGGKRVALFEAEDELGGAWRLEKNSYYGAVENSCHLIEWYLGGYEKLEQLSGVKFIPIVPPPQKINSHGNLVPYTTRFGIAKTFVSDLRGILFSLIRMVIPGRFSREFRIKEFNKNIANFFFLLARRVPGILIFDAVKYPEYGYAAFTKKLVYDLKNSSVEVFNERIQKMVIKNDCVVLSNSTLSVTSEKSIVSDSSILEVQSQNAIYNSDTTPNRNNHVVISALNKDVKTLNKYIQIPNSALFHRVTNIDNKEQRIIFDKTLFLVQLRKAPDDFPNLELSLTKFLEEYGILEKKSKIEILQNIQNDYRYSHQFTFRDIKEQRLLSIKSYGDLSRSVLLCDLENL